MGEKQRESQIYNIWRGAKGFGFSDLNFLFFKEM